MSDKNQFRHFLEKSVDKNLGVSPFLKGAKKYYFKA
jgi:hypothetical protein